MELKASEAGRLFIFSRSQSANGAFFAADATPVAADYSIREGGSNTELAGSHSISVEDHGYLSIFTPTTPLTVGMFIEAQLTAVFSGVTKYDFGSCSVEATATAAEAAAILARLTAITRVFTNPRDPNQLELVRGDAYDDTSWPVLAWTLGKDCSATTVTLTIRDGLTDAVLLTKTGTGNGTGVTVSISSADYDTLTVGQHKFDVQVVFSATSKQTPGLGICKVIEDQTRS